MAPRVVLAAVLLALPAASARGAPAAPPCTTPHASAAYAKGVSTALRSGRDLWGEQLLRAPGGPSYAGAARRLPPLLYARGPKGTKLTESGVYYLAFGQPAGAAGARGVMLHVADGSAVIADRAGGRAIGVAAGTERYGSCLARLIPARLAEGWLPILQTAYVDGRGNSYVQESFTARTGGKLYAFVRLSVDARTATRMSVGPVAVSVPEGEQRALAVRWSASGRPVEITEGEYATARRALVAYWQQRVAEGARLEVPEARVQNALRALLVQELTLTWRYSVGNPYEEFSFPEGVDVAQVMAEQGHQAVARAILRSSLRRPPNPYPAWKMGEKLLGWASYYRLYRDSRSLLEVTPTLGGYVRALARKQEPGGLLVRERYSSDIPDQVYGLHAQAVVWQGLNGIADAWARTGRTADAARARTLAARLGPALRTAVRRSERRLADGSLFVPVRLLDGRAPYRRVTESRAGSYWNLVAPYAFASGLFAPGSREARGAYRYMLLHGSRLLGLVRAGGYALYGRNAPPPTSGTDQVYGINVARFLADLDEPDQLVLSLYGMLGAAMTPDTFVSGEAATVAPLDGQRPRTMYLPPNGASNAAFLETLKLSLVHERGDGLELAYATPRAWLSTGRRIGVRRVPTSFGPVSFSIDAEAATLHVTADLPARARSVKLRLRLPGGATRTLDLSGRSGHLELDVRRRSA